MRKKMKGSLYRMMTVMTIIPLIVFGIVIAIYCSGQFASTIEEEVSENLKNMTGLMLHTYDLMYPGDYEIYVKDGRADLWKGGIRISETDSLLDDMKERTGMDLTIFFYDTRMLTTVYSNGERILGTGCSAVVFRDVFEGKKASFYKSALVNGQKYFAYYEPVFNSDGACVGMAFAGKPTENVQNMIERAIIPIILIILLAVLLTAWFAVGFTTKMVEDVRKMELFISNVTNGNLTDNLDDAIVHREDEIGKMGRAAVKMQRALRELIEQDSLTGLYNRRYGNQRINKIKNRAEQSGALFCVVIGDIDYFKRVNDSYGHEGGDVVLKKIALVLKECMLGKGTAVRWGGEEFLLLFEQSGLEETQMAVREILDRVRAAVVEYNGSQIQVTMTFGIAEGSTAEETDEIIRRADDKLYAGKAAGRNRVVF